jgi:hypothetical protein
LNSTAEDISALSIGQRRIIRQFLYYDLFQYPLREEEVKASNTSSQDLQDLLESGILKLRGELMALTYSEENFNRRLEGNIRADKSMGKALKRGRFIGQFPFVRGVYISGSLSKGFLEEDADVDFFIITKPGRLWLTRTLLIAFKKLFLLNNRKFFCLNYFIDTKHLKISEENMFTATELVTLIGVCDFGYHRSFEQSNEWVKNYYPSSKFKIPTSNCKHGGLKKTLEFLLNGWLGKQLDRLCFWLTLSIWKKKFGHFESEDFELAMKSRKYISKHHPQNFQKKVLEGFQKKIEDFEQEHGLSLSLK